MRWIFLAPLVVLSSFCFGQVPEYLPSDGLIGWYPFNGNTADESGDGNDGENSGAVLTIDRNANVNSAYYFGMEANIRLQSLEDYDWGDAPSTVMAWAKYQGLGDDNGAIIRYDDCASSYVWGITIHESPTELVFHDLNRNGIDDHSITIFPYSPSGWTHYAFVKDPISGSNKAYVNGELIGQISFATSFAPSGEGNPQLLIGSCGGWAHEFGGEIDDIAFFDRALSHEEISNIFNEQPLIYGCTDPSACNYDSDATANNSCEYVTCLCLDGTIWSEELGGCIPATACPQDLDYDGVVGVNDLMNLLSAFGTPCEPPVADWTCGDPVSYHGYDYQTVLIGEQCWFAENLRTELYQNGDSLLTALSQFEWGTTDQGACSVAGEGDSFCNDGCSDGFDACDEVYNLDLHGRLYNGHVVMDSRQICPAEWHISHAEDWDELESFVVDQGFYATQTALPLKQGEGWCTNSCGGYDVGYGVDQVDEFGFSATAGGDRDSGTGPYGGFFSTGCYGTWWSPSLSGEFGAHREVSTFSSHVQSNSSPNYVNHGRSIRCIKD